jgi:hypothetical protein
MVSEALNAPDLPNENSKTKKRIHLRNTTGLGALSAIQIVKTDIFMAKVSKYKMCSVDRSYHGITKISAMPFDLSQKKSPNLFGRGFIKGGDPPVGGQATLSRV